MVSAKGTCGRSALVSSGIAILFTAEYDKLAHCKVNKSREAKCKQVSEYYIPTEDAFYEQQKPHLYDKYSDA